MDSSEVGRFGTLHLMKRLDPTAVAASYPIDEEEITIGRDPLCSIRLYYESVSMLHCKIIFRERKAFVIVLGTNGILVDGCPVFPHNTPSSNPVTVPLTNNSTLEIHKKCFQFCYPPKELRPLLLATPAKYQDPANGKHRRRTLRMSMIQSAQVFSPAPSEDPRENLRILKTPLKTPFRRFAPYEPSPLKRGALPDPEDADEEEEEEDIVLVETNHPKVTEEDNDLVILEHVEVDVPADDPPPPSPGRMQQQQMVQYPIPQPAQSSPQAPRTPRRRAHPRNSLHRAVLLRSAARTAHKIAMEAEEEHDAEEVEETIQAAELEEAEEFEEEEDEEDEEQEGEQQAPVSSWRTSLGAVASGLPWPFRSSSEPEEQVDHQEYETEQPEDEEMAEQPEQFDEEEQNYDVSPDEVYQYYNQEQATEPQASGSMLQDPVVPAASAPPLGNFMTPQMPRISRNPARYSLGGFTSGGPAGSGPRRVKLVDPWKVNDIVVPIKEEVKEEDAANPFISPTKKERLTEEERNAIRERRKSALNTPDNFAPGIGHLSRRMSASPTKAPAPLPALNISQTIHEVKDEEDAEEDTSVMLARMKQMVDGVKRRQSMGPPPSIGASPRKAGQFSLFAPDADYTSPRKTSNPFAPDLQVPEDVDMEDEDLENTAPPPDEIDMAEHEEPTEPQAAASSSRTTLDAPIPATPKFTGMREMFKEAAKEMQTPRMDGMRELFRAERVPATPAYEGVGEMLATPACSEAQEVQLEDEAMYEEEEQEPAPPAPAPAPSRARKPPSSSTSKVHAPAAPRRTTPRAAGSTQKDARQQTLTSVPEDDVSPAESSQPKRPGPASRVSRKPRSQSAEVEPAAGPSRLTRTRTVAKAGPDDEVKPAARKPNAEEPKAPAAPKSAPVRRGRKAAESPTPVEEAQSAPAKVTRKPRSVKTPTEELEDKPTTGTKASGSRRGTQAKAAAADHEEDPLDAIPRSDTEEKKDAGAKVRRSARGKVKEEDAEDSPALATVAEELEDPPAAMGTTRAARTTRKPASKTTTVTPASRSTTRGKAAAGGASAKKVAEEAGPGETGDKENTPEPSTEEDPSDGSAGAAPTTKTAAKVTRSTRSRTTPTPEVEGKGKEALKTKVTRTKTAAKK
ncbi:hypothetical protein EIP91_009798 [Steccherinum ochraceum]|uniref:FHA domain-containing protein n=1 Tax=Steccherinum ochraceum TaxID=92696 RepID=A0A4R0RRB2_9APHY|nr:hypothetical protein EIP91_009798 [Steccherinum ochraceum]